MTLDNKAYEQDAGCALEVATEPGCPAPHTAGVWSYVYRAVDQRGQVIDVYVSQRRDIASARRFFTTALAIRGEPTEIITDRAPALANVIEELVPAAWHNTGQYQNNRVEVTMAA